MAVVKKNSVVASFVADLEVDFEKNYGKGLLQTFDKKPEPFKAVPLGIPSIDKWMAGGLCPGRIYEVFGGESTGKTTFMLTCAAAAQKEGYVVFYIDTEHSFDPFYATNIGVNISSDKFLLSQPDYGEQALQIMQDACMKKLEATKYSDLKLIFIVDSISALVPKSEYEGEMIEDSGGMARQAAMMSSALRQLVGPIQKTDSLALFVNQMRDNVGAKFGPKSVTSGGRAIRFYASVRIQIWKEGEIKKGEESIGIISGMKAVKSKLFPPFKTTKIAITFGKGIDQERMLWEDLLSKKVFKKEGHSYVYKDEKWKGYEGYQERVASGLFKLEDLRNELGGVVETKIEDLQKESEVVPVDNN